MGVRPERVQEALRQEISLIVHNEIKDPRIGFLTITKVELTRDLRYAKVYFSVLGEERERKNALHGLNSAKGYIKGLVADKLKLRFTPELDFRFDNTLEETSRIRKLIDKVHKGESDEQGNRGAEEK